MIRRRRSFLFFDEPAHRGSSAAVSLPDWPTYTVEIGFDQGLAYMILGLGVIGTSQIGGTGDESVTWTAIDGVIEASCSMGRQDELTKIEAGRARFLFDNQDGRFSPENTGSPYYPNVQPLKRIRLTATYDDTYYLFSGYIEQWTPRFDGALHYVEVVAVDGSRRLARRELVGSVLQEGCGARIAEVLDQANIPSGLRDLDDGYSEVAAGSIDGVGALAHIDQVAEVEGGLFWIGGDNIHRFRDRYARSSRAESNTSQATFGGASGLGYSNLVYEYTAYQVYNDIRATPSGGSEQSASDGPSQVAYDVSVLRAGSTWFVSEAEALDWCEAKLALLKDPIPRLRGITMEGGGEGNLWQQMLGRTISDRVTVIHEFPGALGINRDFWLEGVTHTISDGLRRHSTRWSLSRAETQWMLIGDGVIGTSRLGY